MRLNQFIITSLTFSLGADDARIRRLKDPDPDPPTSNLSGKWRSKMARLELSSRDTVEYAAQGGAPDALFELGLIYCIGRDVDIDFVQAHKWFNLAALRGNAAAKRYRQDIAGEMSKAEVARAQRMAREWLAVN
jgi:uncharacterized protein